ncbi:MAG TPA: sulfatase, partial [Thermoanaerobaculia bacterium]
AEPAAGTSAGAGAPAARLELTVRGPRGLTSELRLPVSAGAWAEGSLDLAALAGAGATLRLRARSRGDVPILVSDLSLRHLLEAEDGRRRREAPGLQVLLVSVDTLRADAVGSAEEGERMPGLAAFAAGAERFDPHYATASWTKPSHGSLLTGLPVEAHGAELEDQSLSPAATTLAERFSAAGFRTAGLVYDCLWLDPRFGFDRGFEEYRVVRWGADQAARFTASWIARHRREPFFYFLHLFTPHSDMEVLPYEGTGVSRETVAERFGLEAYGCRRGVCASSLLQSINAGRVAPLPGEEDVLRFLYGRGAMTADRALERLFADLSELGLLDRMLIVVTSDHGEAFFEHGELLHTTVHEEVLRVPLLVRWPDGERGGRLRTEPTSGIDLAPTLLRAAGLPAGDLPGRALQDPPEEDARRRAVFAGTLRKAVVAGPWKAIFPLNDEPARLYRLDEDPGERRDVAAEHPAVLARLRELVVAHVETARALGRPAGEEPAPALTPEERRRLEALGYVE